MSEREKMKLNLSFANDFKKNHAISARLSPELNEHVERYRKRHELSRADVVRDALRHFFACKQEGHN